MCRHFWLVGDPLWEMRLERPSNELMQDLTTAPQQAAVSRILH